MNIGLITESLAHLSFDDLLETVGGMGIERLEFGTGNWAQAPHLRLDELLELEPARREFSAKLQDHSLSISALNCSGNQLAPGEAGKRHDETVRKTIKLANLLGVNRVVLMSGLPAAPGDRYPNWITVAWPPETAEILKYQWEEVAIPYWRDLANYAAGLEVRLCVEPHGHQLVYNTETMLKLRDAAGESVGVNFDPSHMLWMGGEPLSAIGPLAEAIYHVHAKDTRLEENRRPNTLLETKPNEQVAARSWNYVTLGRGHPEAFWRDFVRLLIEAGYDDVLSIEHEDLSLTPEAGVREAAGLLQRILARDLTGDAVKEVAH